MRLSVAAGRKEIEKKKTCMPLDLSFKNATCSAIEVGKQLHGKRRRGALQRMRKPKVSRN